MEKAGTLVFLFSMYENHFNTRQCNCTRDIPISKGLLPYSRVVTGFKSFYFALLHVDIRNTKNLKCTKLLGNSPNDDELLYIWNYRLNVSDDN